MLKLSLYNPCYGPIREEVLWTLKVVICHYFFNSCNDISATFRAMFPDSGITKTFTCGATKCAYLTCFGLAPYFHEQLVDMVRSTACYSISLDECMNRISQNEQMDFIIRYWDGNTNNNNNNCFKKKVQYPKSSVDYNKRYTYIIIVIQYNSFYIMRYDNNPII